MHWKQLVNVVLQSTPDVSSATDVTKAMIDKWLSENEATIVEHEGKSAIWMLCYF
jgi:hypothetical protein